MGNHFTAFAPEMKSCVYLHVCVPTGPLRSFHTYDLFCSVKTRASEWPLAEAGALGPWPSSEPRPSVMIPQPPDHGISQKPKSCLTGTDTKFAAPGRAAYKEDQKVLKEGRASQPSPRRGPRHSVGRDSGVSCHLLGLLALSTE